MATAQRGGYWVQRLVRCSFVEFVCACASAASSGGREWRTRPVARRDESDGRSPRAIPLQVSAAVVTTPGCHAQLSPSMPASPYRHSFLECAIATQAPTEDLRNANNAGRSPDHMPPPLGGKSGKEYRCKCDWTCACYCTEHSGSSTPGQWCSIVNRAAIPALGAANLLGDPSAIDPLLECSE